MNNNDAKSIVQQGYQYFKTQEFGKLMDLFTDDVEWIVPTVPNASFSGPQRGKEQLANYFKEMLQAQTALQFELRDFIAEGDKVAVLGYSRWKVNATHREYETDWIQLFEMRDRKAARICLCHDTAAMAAAFKQA